VIPHSHILFIADLLQSIPLQRVPSGFHRKDCVLSPAQKQFILQSLILLLIGLFRQDVVLRQLWKHDFLIALVSNIDMAERLNDISTKRTQWSYLVTVAQDFVRKGTAYRTRLAESSTAWYGLVDCQSLITFQNLQSNPSLSKKYGGPDRCAIPRHSEVTALFTVTMSSDATPGQTPDVYGQVHPRNLIQSKFKHHVDQLCIEEKDNWLNKLLNSILI
jgi:hypothetical protein